MVSMRSIHRRNSYSVKIKPEFPMTQKEARAQMALFSVFLLTFSAQLTTTPANESIYFSQSSTNQSSHKSLSILMSSHPFLRWILFRKNLRPYLIHPPIWAWPRRCEDRPWPWAVAQPGDPSRRRWESKSRHPRRHLLWPCQSSWRSSGTRS